MGATPFINPGLWLLVTGYWSLVAGYTGCWLLVGTARLALRARMAGVEADPTFYSEFRIPNSKFKSLWPPFSSSQLPGARNQ